MLALADKIRLLREATKGPNDVFALRGRTDDGSPPWKPIYAALDDEMIHRHLAGQVEIGAYALIPSDADPNPRVHWIAADFDGKKEGSNWERDTRQTVRFLLDAGANLLVNLSRSAKGAHVRVLFKDSVPAWMARRWMEAWLREADVVDDNPMDVWPKTSFDLFVPRSDSLHEGYTKYGYRRPGNLIGSPLNGRLCKLNKGATLPISPHAAANGDFEPDGLHWKHLEAALDGREWGEQELLMTMADAPGPIDMKPPVQTFRPGGSMPRRLNVINAKGAIDFTLKFCEFMQYMQQGGEQPYQLWVALASQLHHFDSEEGRTAFHDLSALDPRYKHRQAEQKWEQTADMHPIKCKTLVSHGYVCPHLGTRRCGGAAAPAYLFEHAHYEPL